jgi:chorismate mutase
MFGMPADDTQSAPSETPSPDLEAIRRAIDDVDRRMVALLAERARLVGQVVRYKRSRHMAVVDRAREERMLDRIGSLAEEEGLDPRVARQVLRTVIDGFTLLEVEELGPNFGSAHGG